jgi:hypothetical protein
MLNLLERPAKFAIDLSIGGVAVRLDAPHEIADVLRATLANVPGAAQAAEPIVVSARRSSDSWEIRGASGNRKLLDPKSGLTQIAGAVVSSAIAEAAVARGLRTVRATVVEKNGLALAMIGADWEAAVTIATHLHTRGWRYISGDHCLYDPQTRQVVGFEKSLYITSSSIAHLPVVYRRAIEASPWCATRHGISFYAVDPAVIGAGAPWATSAWLHAVLFVDGREDELPALESLDAGHATSAVMARFADDQARLAAAEVTIGSYVPTCDLIEHWFASLET